MKNISIEKAQAASVAGCRAVLIGVCILLIQCLVYLPAAHAQDYGRIRIMQQRADQIIKKKNSFVARVLSSYNILYELNAQGLVVRINVDGRWLNVTAIDVVPVLQETKDKQQQVAAQELFFHTDHGILNVESGLTIR